MKTILTKKALSLVQFIKQPGEFTVPVRLDSQSTANVAVTVTKDE